MQEMFEQTNQTEEVQMEEAQEQEFEQSFHAQEEDTSGADTQEIMNEAFALNVKYNGVEQTLSEDEARVFAQKGMNYDHVMQELTQLRSAPEIAIVGELARKAGMNKEDFLNHISAQVHKEAAERENSEQEALRREVNQFRDRDAKMQRWSEFFRMHPEIARFESLPEEVKQAVAHGADPGAAYLQYENEKLKDHLEMARQSAYNKAVAPGSAASAGSGEQADPFLQAFMQNI